MYRALPCAALSVLALAAAPASAQEQDKPIVVIAKVPAFGELTYPGSADSYGADQLRARAFEDLTSLSYASPNVSLDAIGTFKGVANFAIRGLGINSSIPSIDPAVGLFVDGVYIGVNAGTVFDALDVARIDILRGPQGVAFGRNTTGGAVLVQTADPTWTSEGSLRVGLNGPVDSGRGAGEWSARGVYSGPLSSTVAVRLGALYSLDQGYFENRFDGQAFGREETQVLRGALALRPSTALSIVVKGEWTGGSGDGATTHNNGQNARDRFDLAVNQRGYYDSDNAFVTARGELDLGPGKLTDIVGWRRYDLGTRNDIDSSPLSLFHSDTATRQRQWSNELFYAAKLGPARVVAGSYLFGQTIGYDEARDLSGLGAAPAYGGGRQEHQVYGLYASAEVPLTPALTLSGGLRWSREEKSAEITYVRARAACSAIAATCPVTGSRVAGENNGFSDARAWENLAPRVALSFVPLPRLALYGSWTRGQRSGGYNLRITQPAAFEQVAAQLGSPAFDEEQVDSFELGLRWRAADGFAELQGALFQTEVDNLQREINVPSATSGLAQSVYNTADSRITGGELEVKLAPVAGLELTANLGLTDARYTRAFFDINSDNAITAADLALKLPRAPKATWGGSASYAVPLFADKSLRAAAFFQHRDRYAYTDNNWGFNSASDRLDATLSLACGSCGVTVTVFARNLLDEVQFGGDTQLPFAGGAFSDGNNRPFDPRPAAGTFSPVQKGRVLGVELGAEF